MNNILNLDMKREESNTHQSSLDYNVIQKVIAYISANLANKNTLEELSVLTNISPFHLSREFSKATGYTPHQYLEKLRMKHGAVLLRTSGLSVMDIALEIGYSHSHFSRLFKKYYHLSPLAYRRERALHGYKTPSIRIVVTPPTQEP